MECIAGFIVHVCFRGNEQTVDRFIHLLRTQRNYPAYKAAEQESKAKNWYRPGC